MSYLFMPEYLYIHIYLENNEKFTFTFFLPFTIFSHLLFCLFAKDMKSVVFSIWNSNNFLDSFTVLRFLPPTMFPFYLLKKMKSS